MSQVTSHLPHRWWPAIGALLAVIVLAAPVLARTEGTLHDFRTPQAGGTNAAFPNLGKIAGNSPCKVCHVTFGMGGQKYMWGDDYGWEPTEAITLPESVFCAGCHDGTIVTKTGTDAIPDAAMMVKNHFHPLESLYPVSGEKGFRPPVQDKKGNWSVPTKWNTPLPLFASEDDEEAPRITCLTCHNPHEFGEEKLFLRVPSKAELCAACHNK